MKKIIISLIVLSLFSCVTTNQESEDYTGFVLTEDIHSRFSIGMTFNLGENDRVTNVYKGEITRINRDKDNPSNLGRFIEVKTKLYYYWYENVEEVDLYFLYSNLNIIDENLNIGDTIPGGTLLGFAGVKTSPIMNNDDLMISTYTKSDNILVEYLSATKGWLEGGVYWYSPKNFIFNSLPKFLPLTYRDTDITDNDLMQNSLGYNLRGFVELKEYPNTIDPDAVNLFITAMSNNLLPLDYQNGKYNYTYSLESETGKIIYVFREEVATAMKENGVLGTDIYLYGRVSVVDEEKGVTLFFVDTAAIARFEDLN